MYKCTMIVRKSCLPPPLQSCFCISLFCNVEALLNAEKKLCVERVISAF